ncbi:MAG TPA: hypothetical protein VNX68_02615 [Nitrosopumilaceae archaeon]|jgi:hypothetical protein|nr:hypothetical protein [Nitrosopumilaceae archaeon]
MNELDLTFARIRYEDPVIFIIFKEGAELGTEQVLELIAISEKFSNYQPYLLFSDARVFLNITAEARKISASKEKAPLVKANAVMVNNVAIRLTGNVFINFNKPHFPVRLFEDEKKAMEWLLKHTIYNSSAV